MIHATLRHNPYPAADTLIVSEMPKHGEVISVDHHGYNTVMKVLLIEDRWNKPYIHLVNKYNKHERIEAYLAMKV